MAIRWTFALLFALPLGAAEVKLKVGPSENGGASVPLCAEIAAPTRFGSVVMKDVAGQRIPCQWEDSAETGKILLHWIEKETRKGEALRRTAVFLDRPAEPGARGVEVKQAGEKIDVLIGGELLTSYHFSPELPKPFCHPVIGPTGEPVTRAFPMVKDVPGETRDHKHHRSWYFTFGKVNGVDFWAESKRSGRIVHSKFERLTSGPVFGELRARNDWVALDGKKVLEDVRSYRIYNVPDHRLIDWTVQLRATEGPVTMGDTKEGMASFRVAKGMRARSKRGGRIENANGGIGERQCWGKPSAWCDYVGPVAGRIVGIALLDHPTSFRHPTRWHIRGYGLLAANPFGHSYFLRDKTKDGSHEIPAGGQITFKYRVYIHEGGAAEADVAGKYANFARPPIVKAE